MRFGIQYLTALIITASALEVNQNPFPEHFKLGVSTSAYQIEGAWNEDGKGSSIWDDFAHEYPELIQDGSNGDIACDSYHRYKEDVALLKELGVQLYRFSISWPRILPNGTSNNINEAGIEYYTNLLKLLQENGIEPIVTLYHADLPSVFQEMGGWDNPEIVNYFGDYVRLCFLRFGQYVKYWVTINEPISTCDIGYPYSTGYLVLSESVYLCAYTNMKAHALAYHIYQDEFQKEQQGKISLSSSVTWYEPASNSTDDQEAQDLALQFSLGLFAHPIFVGNWPQVVIDRVGNRSALEGLPQSRLPEFTREEIDYIKGTYDWFGLNYYTTALAQLAYKVDDLPGNASYDIDKGHISLVDATWKVSGTTSWLHQVPWGLTRLLKWIHENYNQPEIIITENGWSDDGSNLNDSDRIEYVNLHLSSVLDAIYNHNVAVTGYTQWSFMDNFEWSNGYTAKFGAISVDFANENRTRTPKASFYWYQKVIKNRCLNETFDGDVSAVATRTPLLYVVSTALIILKMLY
ncbi:myrosinase 1 [Dendroctonus ponderosae]|uniref:myrosinase 1 n=2 Tax=Dendroctonus ponderosae TaxID=77166 RepID=UPI0020350AAE|nr:myrosinase 1 [Dendroctonus ponderosae]